MEDLKTCEACSESFPKGDQHFENIELHQCCKCKNQFKYKMCLKIHFETVHENKKYFFICEICLTYFTKQSALDIHASTAHSSSKKHRCIICKIKLDNRSALLKHRKTHIEVESKHQEVACPSCKEIFKSQELLCLHAKPFQCCLCDKHMKSSNSFKNHLNNFHKKFESIKSHKCQHCEYRATHEDLVHQHMKEAHIEEKPFSCEKCPKKFGKNTEKILHYRSVHSKLTCHICFAKYSKRYHLNMHLQSFHNNIMPFSCSGCEKKFKTNKFLKNHFNRVHLKLRPLQCQFCPAKFANKSDCNFHVQSVHENVRKIKCLMCTATYKSQDALKYHLKAVHEKMNTLCVFI